MKSKKTALVSSNIFLLTHKCGNNYIQEVFRKNNSSIIGFLSDELLGQFPGRSITEVKNFIGSFVNIRCRNFTPQSIDKLNKLIDLQKTNFFLIVRHPGSFFRSAVSYHMRGKEHWARTNIYSILENKTLFQALNEAKDLERKLIVAMKLFGLHFGMINNWIMCHQYLTELGLNLTIIKTEDLFLNGDNDYFEMLSNKMSHDGFFISSRHLKESSPINLPHLPLHSTGEFKKEYLDGYKGKAIEMYNQFFLGCQKFFYSD